jgi:glycosyltransferase involved in cell wall biosynthesis
MPKSSLPHNPSDRAQASLDAILREGSTPKAQAESALSVAEARTAGQIFEVTSDRRAVRLLIISRDSSLLNQTTQSLDGYLNLSEVFDEVHILILRPGIPAKDPVLRVAMNTWLYVATAKHWWQTPMAALDLINEQFSFADGFRPDLIVARDPYESALTAYLVGKRYDRPTQVHVLDDLLLTKATLVAKADRWRRRLGHFMIRKFLSVRTATDQLTTMLATQYPRIPDVSTLPRFQSYDHLLGTKPGLSLKQRYPQFVFIILYIGSLHKDSTAFRAIDAVRGALRNPRVGLVIVGEGSARGEFMKRAQILGLGSQVIFEKSCDDIVAYLASADTLLVTDTDGAGDEWALRGAAVGVPLVLTSNSLRTDVFTDGTSALMALPVEVNRLGQHIESYLNDSVLRMRLKTAAQQMIMSRFHADPIRYQAEFKESIEHALIVEPEE